MSDSRGFSCVVTGFAGMEPEILRLRNTNRDTPETPAYLTWRYHVLSGLPPPSVHWLLDPNGRRVGMAAAIFRPYRLNGAPVPVAVIGDISIDGLLRGRGLGQLLLRSMTTYLDDHFPRHPALVIPTDSARRALNSVGWAAGGELAPLTYVLDPEHYIRRVARSRVVAAAVARSLRAAARALVRRHIPPEGALHLSDSMEEPLSSFAQRLPVVQGIVREMGPESLAWRYAQHPHIRFGFATYQLAGEVRGFLIFEDRTAESMCSIYDLVGETPQDLRAMLALFVARGLATPGLATLRVTLDGQHPARVPLRQVGFIVRPVDAVFQVHASQLSAPGRVWRITQGDKDI